MFYVYLLSDKTGKIYVGYTANLRLRIQQHKNKRVYWTKRLNKPTLIYYEAYPDSAHAKIRERKLKKRGSSYQGLLKRIGLK